MNDSVLNAISSTTVDYNGQITDENNVIQEQPQEQIVENTTEEASKQEILEELSKDKKEEEKEEEPPKEEEKKEEIKKPEDSFSRKFAALSKKERQLRQREQQINAKLAELENKLKTMETPKKEEAPKVPLEKLLRKDPLSALKEMGLTYEKLTELYLNEGKLPVEDKIELIKEELDNKYKSEIEAIRNELIEKDKKQAEEEYNKTVQNYMNELTSFINNNEDYEMIRANDSVSLVYDVILEHFNNTTEYNTDGSVKTAGRILTNKEAADHVEATLLEEARKLLKLKKLGYKEEIKPSTQPAPKKESVTLTNNMATPSIKSQPSKTMTLEESKAAAAALIKWDD